MDIDRKLWVSDIRKSMLCRFLDAYRAFLGLPPSLSCWFETHPAIASNVKWQFKFDTTSYDVPETAKIAWPNWSNAQKTDLDNAYVDAWKWYKGRNPFRFLSETITYPPTNIDEQVADDNASPYVKVDQNYAWDLYIRWIALNLVQEIGGHFAWSITNYNSDQLQVLFDSTSMMTMDGSGRYVICTGNPGHPNFIKRKDNMGESLPAPPRYTYVFLKTNAIVGATRKDTIVNLLQWVSNNLAHFYGVDSFANMQAHWQYRGIPPITAIIEGTTSTAVNPPEFRHWTAGCHGTAGFLRNVLRAANIPVQIVRICGHSVICFITEDLYLDHGDDPYNLTFKASGHPVSDLLIDAATYTAWFGTNPDNHDDPINCPFVGHQVDVLSGP